MRLGILAIALIVIVTGRAQAGTAFILLGNSPVVNIQMTTGTLTIKTWNRPGVGIDTDGTINWQHYPSNQVTALMPTQFATLAETIQTPQGPLTLAPEIWVLPALSSQRHDGLVVRGNGKTTISIPAGTALVAARLTTGRVTLRGYRNGVFFAAVHAGGIALQNITGTGFAQVVRGPIVAANSSFLRFRGRTAAGNILFENVDSQQIAVSTMRGSIVYDNGSFEPGLARFEADYGNVALGVGSGGAQIGAHSDAGHIVTDFSNSADVTRSSATTDTHATVGSGGATVTANFGARCYSAVRRQPAKSPKLTQSLSSSAKFL